MGLRFSCLFLYLIFFSLNTYGQTIFVKVYYDDDSLLLKNTYHITDSVTKTLHGQYKQYFHNQNISIKGNFDKGKEAGAWFYYYETGEIKAQGVWEDGMRNGVWKSYYENGELKQSGFFDKGKKNGAWTYFYESGKRKKFGAYIDDKREKVWNYFGESGKLKAQAYYRSDAGLYKEFYPSGRLKMEGINAEGKSEGVWKYYYESGELEAQGSFENGYKSGLWKFYHKNGQLSSRGNFEKGVAVGSWEEYFEDGAIASRGDKKEGKKEGHWELYFESGRIRGVEDFNGEDGTVINYYENGTIRSEGKLKNNKQTSRWRFYDQKGNLEGVADFKEGVGEYTGLYADGSIKMKGTIDDYRRVGKWELYNEDGSLAGYYHPIYEKEPPTYIITSDLRSRYKYDKPNYEFRKRKSRYFQPVVNEYKGVILGGNPAFALAGLVPIALEYYVQERIGYEIQYTYKASPFFTMESDIANETVYTRGASIELKQKFYNQDSPNLGMLYFGHLIRLSNEGSFVNTASNGTPEKLRLDTRRFDYGVFVGNRWMKDPGNSSFTVDVYFGFGVGLRTIARDDDPNRQFFDESKRNSFNIPIIFGLNLGYSLPARTKIRTF